MSYSCADKVLLLADGLHLTLKIIIFHFWWFTRGEIPPLLVLLGSSERAMPAAPLRRWWVRSGRAQVTSGASLGGCPPGARWGLPAAPAGQPLAAARPFLALHWLLLFHIPVAEMTCCGAQSQTSHRQCSALCRPQANPLWKWLSCLAPPQVTLWPTGDAKGSGVHCSVWCLQPTAASCVNYRIRLASNFKLGVLPLLAKGEKVFVLAQRNENDSPSACVVLHIHCKYKHKYLNKFLCSRSGGQS